MAQISIPDDQINNAVRSIVKDLGLVPREDLRAYCPPLDDVRKDYFRNHSKAWVRNLIFDRFPETLDVNGGWAINPSGKGPGIRGTYVKFEQMKQWLDEHDDEIDWYEKLASKGGELMLGLAIPWLVIIACFLIGAIVNVIEGEKLNVLKPKYRKKH